MANAVEVVRGVLDQATFILSSIATCSRVGLVLQEVRVAPEAFVPLVRMLIAMAPEAVDPGVLHGRPTCGVRIEVAEDLAGHHTRFVFDWKRGT